MQRESPFQDLYNYNKQTVQLAPMETNGFCKRCAIHTIQNALLIKVVLYLGIKSKFENVATNGNK